MWGLILTVLVFAGAGFMPVSGWSANKGGHAAAEVHVGKLDGADAPSLMPLATPGMGDGAVLEEKMADSGLPVFFEKSGDLQGAAHEWVRLARDSMGEARTRALVKAADDLAAAGDMAGAARMYGGLAEAQAQSQAPLEGELLYKLAKVVPDTMQPDVGLRLARYLEEHPDDHWVSTALYERVWTEAQAGPVRMTYNLPKAKDLQARLHVLDEKLEHRAQMAAMLGGVLPGLGHAWLGETAQAGVLLAAWAVAMWLVVWSFKRRQHPYVVLWVAVVAGVWIGSSVSALAAARQQNQVLRMRAMAAMPTFVPGVEGVAASPVSQSVVVPMVSATSLPAIISVTGAK